MSRQRTHSNTPQAISGNTTTGPTPPDPITRNQRERRIAWLIFAALAMVALVVGEVIT